MKKCTDFTINSANSDANCFAKTKKASEKIVKCNPSICEGCVYKEELYYIRQEGYCGNALYWWPQDRKGYVTDIRKAGKFSLEEAREICKRESDTAYRVEYINNLLEGQKLIIDAQYVSSAEQLFIN